VRSIAIDALRGQIWTEDQYGKPNGKPLVQNRSSLEVRVDKQELEESGVAEQVLGELSAMLDIPVKQIRRDLESPPTSTTSPSPSRSSWTRRWRSRSGRAGGLPGVQVRTRACASTPMGKTASHMVGWVGQVQRAQLEQDEFPTCDGSGPNARCYGPNDMAGQTGLEVQYERWLRGTKGLQRYVVNSDGERIRDLGGRQPTPGGDLVLTIDSEWQRAVESSLEESILRTRQVFDEDSGTYFKADAGVVIVLDVETGGLKAMASWPYYDPRWFVRGLQRDEVCYLGLTENCSGADKVGPIAEPRTRRSICRARRSSRSRPWRR
jgi:penicillin-binding protein 2